MREREKERERERERERMIVGSLKTSAFAFDILCAVFSLYLSVSLSFFLSYNDSFLFHFFSKYNVTCCFVLFSSFMCFIYLISWYVFLFSFIYIFVLFSLFLSFFLSFFFLSCTLAFFSRRGLDRCVIIVLYRSATCSLFLLPV